MLELKEKENQVEIHTWQREATHVIRVEKKKIRRQDAMHQEKSEETTSNK